MDVLAEVSALAGLDLRPRGRLPGGEQGGADLVVDGAGRLLVVKRQHDPSKAARLLNAAAAVGHATARGWPAARWLWAGRLADGTAAVVQDHVRGRPVTDLDAPTVAAILAANERQAGLAHPGAFDDSAQLRAVVSSHPWKDAVAGHSRTGARLVRHGDAVLVRAGQPELPAADVVHGDCSSTNMIVTGDGIVFVDCESVGRGTRVRDLADLYRQCFLYPQAPADAMDLLQAGAAAIAGPAVLAPCVVGVTYNNLAWWVENKPEPDVDVACRRAEDLFDVCEALCR